MIPEFPKKVARVTFTAYAKQSIEFYFDVEDDEQVIAKLTRLCDSHVLHKIEWIGFVQVHLLSEKKYVKPFTVEPHHPGNTTEKQ